MSAALDIECERHLSIRLEVTYRVKFHPSIIRLPPTYCRLRFNRIPL